MGLVGTTAHDERCGDVVLAQVVERGDAVGVELDGAREAGLLAEALAQPKLADAALFYLSRYASSSGNLRRVLMRKVGRAALLAAMGGVLVPFCGGVAVAIATGADLRAALFIGAILTATSVGITAAVLGELGLLRSEGKEYVVKDGDILFFKFNV